LGARTASRSEKESSASIGLRINVSMLEQVLPVCSPQLSENAQLGAVSCQRSAIRRRILKEIYNACIEEM
jgi:hypothetical protein